MTDLESACINSEIGWIKITASENGIRKLEFEESGMPNKKVVNPYLKECLKELGEYFEGKRQKLYGQTRLGRNKISAKSLDLLTYNSIRQNYKLHEYCKSIGR